MKLLLAAVPVLSLAVPSVAQDPDASGIEPSLLDSIEIEEVFPRGPEPVGSPGDWLSPYDYPTQALRAKIEGVVSFRLEIDDSGWATNCTIVNSSGSALLDDTACARIKERARFKPALDDFGNAVTGYYINSVRWIIPEPATPTHPEPGSFVLTFVAEPDGTVSECSVLEASSRDFMWSGISVTDRFDLCEQLPETRMGVLPYNDEEGNAVRKRINVTYRIEVIDEPEVSGKTDMGSRK